MSSKQHVLIAGGGIGGLTAALALLQKGFDVTVFEQAQALREIGAGVQLSPNGVRVLYALGLKAEADRLGVDAQGKEVRVWNSGKTWPLFNLGAESIERYGVPYLMMHRADLHKILLESVLKLKPDACEINSRAVSFEQDGSGVTLQLEDGRSVAGDVLIGADGLHSNIRKGLFGPDKPEFTGGCCWRGIIDMKRLPAHLRRPVGVNWIGPEGHVILYPVRSGSLLNFVGHVEREGWASESWTEEGSHEELRRDYAGWHEDIQTIVGQIDTPYKWALFLREPLQKWSQGRVSLLGDACHATLPYLAQGANMAIEDGLVLARALSEFDDVEAGLQRYEQARVERTTRIVNKSAENLGRFHNHALLDPATADGYVDKEWAPEKIRERYEWIMSYDAVTTSL
ncbi:MAG: FAD-dependent monooxygenase [Pigmentiphaga sp.]|uniref:FAD-dependent monooxygenase n=1 Tax=Pigmentiphaga sp. TaxID=1977564 RepID=UPI0029B62F0A|nr:FAD-dependent monooxygenase [Pigmentiphaga sp.]MDX3905142.1 FAD-dependent monooxygenase [Pigmentiphaga sp.]